MVTKTLDEIEVGDVFNFTAPESGFSFCNGIREITEIVWRMPNVLVVKLNSYPRLFASIEWTICDYRLKYYEWLNDSNAGDGLW